MSSCVDGVHVSPRITQDSDAFPAEFSGDSGVFGLLVFGPLVNPGFQGGLVQRSAALSIHYVDVGPGCAEEAEHGYAFLR